MNSKFSLSITSQALPLNTALRTKPLTDPSRGTFHIQTITVTVPALSSTMYRFQHTFRQWIPISVMFPSWYLDQWNKTAQGRESSCNLGLGPCQGNRKGERFPEGFVLLINVLVGKQHFFSFWRMIFLDYKVLVHISLFIPNLCLIAFLNYWVMYIFTFYFISICHFVLWYNSGV